MLYDQPEILLTLSKICRILRIIIYTGKGGTGKTVNSCSTAVKLADNNYNTLLLSSDPAHSLSDAFQIDFIGNEPKKIIDNLYAIQVDPILEISKYFKSILTYLASVFYSKGVDETISYEIAMLPGMTQLFSLLEIEESVNHGNYDAIVLDMPASGEALRYLYFPKLAGSIGRKLTGFTGVFSGFAKMFQPFSGFYGISPNSGVLKDEMGLITKLEKLSSLIINPNITSLRLIVNPDTFSIENAKRTLMSANLYGINVDLVIINKIMPMSISDEYFANWSRSQNYKVQEAKSNFYPLIIREAKLYGKELRGVDMLREHGNLIFKTDDPLKIFHLGNVFEFIKEESGLIIKLKVPFTDKENFEIKRFGDQLSIKINGPIGYVINVVPLPIATIGMNIASSKLVNNELIIFFKNN
ncbi:MAG TPA: TRC40/GET3/ArsA family transport-energizing ATPase [Candidatus Nitrosocosmicus sp.]|nr:TRC40/GET3/ArsA family transport-energizing ATPase [Candidatus Nitrosocosmicus sp.]